MLDKLLEELLKDDSSEELLHAAEEALRFLNEQCENIGKLF